MKNIVKIQICTILLLLASCKKIDNFLEKAPGVDVNENTIFSSVAQLNNFIPTLYRYGINSGFGQRGNNNAISTTGNNASNYGMIAGITDEGRSEAGFVEQNVSVTSGNISAQNIINQEDYRYGTRWILIRYVAIMLERLKDVPLIDPAYAKQVEGEAKFLRALNYFEMVKRYGGVMLVDKRFNVGDQINIPRSSLQDSFNFIIKDLDDAISLLPATVPSNQYGRASKGAALLLKARTLLYQASPLFNTTTPYMNFGANNKLICLGNNDPNRWKLAADASKATLDWAASSGCALIDNVAQRNPSYVSGTPTTGNYKASWETYGNSEIILSENFEGPINMDNFPWLSIRPYSFGGYWNSTEVLFNHIKKYEKLDGTPQTWPTNGGPDVMTKYAELDPRFRQTVAFNLSYYNKDLPSLALYAGGKQNSANSGVFTGNFLKKYWPDALANSASYSLTPQWIVLRLNEAYLDYAEALNEFSGPTTEAYNAVNTIRARSGMPALPSGLSQSDFRTRVRNERDVELAFEDHRFFDIRRWMIAENDGVMKGNMFGISVTKNGSLYSWVPVLVETRSFQHQFYLHPFPYNEVLKGNNLIQNPGW